MAETLIEETARRSPTSNASTFRTRKRIQDAFLELAETTNFSDINVKLLTHAAGLNRTTFYLHYGDVSELAEETMATLIDELDVGGKLLAQGMRADDPNWQESFFHAIASRPVLYRRLLANPESSPLAGRIMALHMRNIKAIWRTYGIAFDPEDPKWRLRVRFAAGGTYELSLQWLEDDMNMLPEVICAHCLDLILHTAKGLD